MLKKVAVAVAMLSVVAGPALAEEPGSGLYAENCSKPFSGYDITINSDGMATVQNKGEVYENVLTSYSFFGDDTPSDFIVAIMFDENSSPLPPYKGDTGWLEIWESDPDPYLLENGRASKEMGFCN